jgi:hypothetical protein
VVAARVGGGGGGAQSGFRRKKTAGRLTGWARLSVRGRRQGRLGRKGEGVRWAATGLKGGGREVGRGWAENRKWLDKILSNFIWNLDFWQKLAQGDFEGILTWGFFLKSSRLLKDF